MSDAYTDNADGSSSVAHTGPNGTVTSYYDRFGRITSVTRPEFNTAYTYDSSANSPSYGSLLSEISTNETLKEITYDNLGRTATITTMVCIPDTLLLQKTFSYGTDGNVASVQYETVEGPVTTETYHYSYGHRDPPHCRNSS